MKAFERLESVMRETGVQFIFAAGVTPQTSLPCFWCSWIGSKGPRRAFGETMREAADLAMLQWDRDEAAGEAADA